MHRTILQKSSKLASSAPRKDIRVSISWDVMAGVFLDIISLISVPDRDPSLSLSNLLYSCLNSNSLLPYMILDMRVRKPLKSSISSFL